MVLKPRLRLFERQARALDDRIDRPGREPAAEQLAHELDRVAAGDTVSDREGGDGRLEAGTEGAAGNVAGSSARVRPPQTGQRRHMRRCSPTSTAISGSSATWWRAGSPVGSRSPAWNT